MKTTADDAKVASVAKAAAIRQATESGALQAVDVATKALDKSIVANVKATADVEEATRQLESATDELESLTQESQVIAEAVSKLQDSVRLMQREVETVELSLRTAEADLAAAAKLVDETDLELANKLDAVHHRSLEPRRIADDLREHQTNGDRLAVDSVD